MVSSREVRESHGLEPDAAESGGRRIRGEEEEGREGGGRLTRTVEKGAEEEKEGREGEEYGGTTAGRGRAGKVA
jgi:hypothetical protein